MRYFKTSIFILLGFLPATHTNAETFRSLSYSGRLVQSDGSPKTGVVNLEIKFFDSELEETKKVLRTYFHPPPLLTVCLIWRSVYLTKISLRYWIRPQLHGWKLPIPQAQSHILDRSSIQFPTR